MDNQDGSREGFGTSPRQSRYDAVVIGTGPNGFGAAITLAEKGRSVLMVEAAESIGGGMRSEELTLPGFVHDVCSAVHPLAAASPFLRALPLDELGVELLHPEIPVAHPLEGGRAAVQHRLLAGTVNALGEDGEKWERMIGPLVDRSTDLYDSLLGPLPFPPRHPVLLSRFGLRAVRSAAGLAKGFTGAEAQALFAGHAAHSILPLNKPLTAAVGVMLAVSAHAVGWPVIRGGSGRLAAGLANHFSSLGGEVVTGWKVDRIEDLPESDCIIFTTGPRDLARAAPDLPENYRRALMDYRYGPGVWKLDLALSQPIPWTNPSCRKAGTVHVGGTLDEVAESESVIWKGKLCERPFVLVAQQSTVDASRAPEGKHTCWAYCHVPHNCDADATESILSQIERFAPGFRDCIIASNVMGPRDIAARNRNNIGGDVIGGVQDLGQLFTRPAARWCPYSTPDPKIFIGSASAPPGAGVHGMGGVHAARAALHGVLRG